MSLPGTVRQRILVGCLSLSMAGFVSITSREGYTDEAVIPTKGDVPTLGLGSTSYEDGTRVKMGDKVRPPRAIQIAAAHITKDEEAFRASLPGVALHQAEFDVYLDFTYQFGVQRWLGSSMRKELLAGNYTAACNALLAYRKADGYDCSTTVNGKPNKVCWGVWTRQRERNQKCLAAQ